MAGLMETDYGQGWFDAESPVPRGLTRKQGPQGAPRYAVDESQKMDPNRMLWAGTLMDVGASFGNALAGTGASTGNAMRLYGHARESNQALDDRAIAMNEQMRQRRVEAEERELQRRLIESRIGKYEADAVPSGPEIVGSPQKLGNGNLGFLNSNGEVIDTGEKFYDPLDRFSANGGEFIFDRRTGSAIPVQVTAPGNTQPPQAPPQGGSQAPAGEPTTAPSQNQPTTLTPELSAQREAERQAAIDRARAEAKRETEREIKMPEWKSKLADIDTQIKNIQDLKANIDDVGFGVLEGRFTGGTPILGSQYDDLFDSIASSQVLDNAQQMTGVLSESDIALIRSMGLDRTRGREFNERQINQLMDVYSRAANALRQKIGVEPPQASTQEEAGSEDDLINKYLD